MNNFAIYYCEKLEDGSYYSHLYQENPDAVKPGYKYINNNDSFIFRREIFSSKFEDFITMDEFDEIKNNATEAIKEFCSEFEDNRLGNDDPFWFSFCVKDDHSNFFDMDVITKNDVNELVLKAIGMINENCYIRPLDGKSKSESNKICRNA